MNRLRVMVFALLGLLLSPLASADESRMVYIGVLSFLSKEETAERWSPTAEYLSDQIDGYQFEFVPKTYPELNEAAGAGTIDFVFTNPEHHVFLTNELGLSAFATLTAYSNGVPLDRFGGVLVTRADSNIQTLEDVHGRNVASVSRQSLGGYLAQRGLLLEHGVDLEGDVSSLQFTGMPHANAIYALQEGSVDVALVRTGVLENLFIRGEVDPADIRVLNQQSEDIFPQLLSTPLYPEWPFSAMPETPESLVTDVVVALLTLAPGQPAAVAGRYYGFAPPADYRPVDRLMEQLRVGPYAEPQRFDLIDIYRKYATSIALALSALLLLAMLMIWQVSRINGRLQTVVAKEKTLTDRLRDLNADLSEKMAERERDRQALARSEQRLSILFDSMHDTVFVVDANDCITEFFQTDENNHPVSDPDNCIGQDFKTIFPQPVVNALQSGFSASLHEDQSQSVEYQLTNGQGQTRWYQAQINRVDDPMRKADSWLVVVRDITHRKQIEERLKLDASVFHYAHEGILITNAAGVIIEVNEAFSKMTGYARSEILGKNPRFLQSGRQDKDFYHHMWDSLLDDGYFRGEIWNRRKDGQVYAQLAHISAVRDANGEISHFVGLFSDITPLKDTERQLREMAYNDALTNLPNRARLGSLMTQAMKLAELQQCHLAVVYMDLDGFKPVNDNLGHDKGDELLMQVADRLRKCIRGMDTVARLGGDEFIILFNEIEDTQGCKQALNRVLHAIEAPFDMDGERIEISASMGVTLYPDDPSDADTLIRHADQAMYRAKQDGRNGYHFFDPAHDREIKKQLLLVDEVRHGMQQEQLLLYFQPKVDMETGTVCGAEALIRWQHPEKGLLAPGAFLPAVEESDFAVDLGEWVIADALQWARHWHAQGVHLPVSVNISPRHLELPDFTQRLSALLSKHPELPAQTLELEILETAALLDMERVSELIDACAKMGVLFSLDDFGTGYSSLTYLKRLPAQTLKIDQSFVRDMLEDQEDHAIVEGVVGLAHAFERNVIAEGAETAQHCRALLALGCTQVQGYGIARPMPAAHLADWIAQFKPDSGWLKSDND